MQGKPRTIHKILPGKPRIIAR